MSDPLLLSREDTLARVPYAAVLSAFFPGVGHLVLGQTTKGFAILAGWVICIVWAITQRNDLEMIFRTVGGQSRHPNYVVLLPIAIGAVIYVSTLMSFKGMSRTTVKKNIHRPPPPTEGGNLPFE